MPNPVVKRVANDHLPDLACRYDGVDITGYQTLSLSISYKPSALTKSGVVVSAAQGRFKFTFDSKVETTLDAAADDDDETIQVDVADYASLPSSGELVIDVDELREVVQYTSKTAPNILNLATALRFDHDAGATVVKLGDLRAGKWDAEVSVTDASGKTRTFSRFTFDIAQEIA